MLIGVVLGLYLAAPASPLSAAETTLLTGEAAKTILTNSAWSKQLVLERPGRNPEAQITCTYTVRLYSALPIRSAYVRLFQLMHGYDDMTLAEQADFDQRHSTNLRPAFRDKVIINIDFQTNDRDLSRRLLSQFKHLDTVQWRQSVQIIGQRKGITKVLEYLSPTPDGTGAKFVFPRNIVHPDDTEFTFKLNVPGTDHQLIQTWKIQDLSFEGRPEF
jgi:hypothetical protein